MVLDEKLLLGRNNPWGGKSLLDEKPPSLTEFVVESLEVVRDEKLLLGRNNPWEENPCWMKTFRLRV